MWDKIRKTIALCLVGGVLYCCMEGIWRGYTHWTMFLLAAFLFSMYGLGFVCGITQICLGTTWGRFAHSIAFFGYCLLDLVLFYLISYGGVYLMKRSHGIFGKLNKH
jgi:phosphoglycerol transferase MdoB-like AlkP superfamily enzyme